MALPYPEGEVFFMRSVLANRDPVHYHADNPEHFYSHFMVEYIWNVEADHGSKNANSWDGHYHQRSPYAIVTGGDAAEAWFMTMPMPTKEERWVWIDLLARIQAIYIPVAYSASEDYPQLSMWLQVSFTQARTVDIWRGGDTFLGHETHPREKGSWFEDFFKNAITFGLGLVPGLGPILSIAFSLGWTAVVNPDKFMYELSLWAPSVKLPELFEDDVRKNAAEIRGLTYDVFWNMQHAQELAEANKLGDREKNEKTVSGEVKSYFDIADEVLRVSEAKDDKEDGADEGHGEVLVHNPPWESPANGHAEPSKE
ncbi:hypothetical protein IL306_008618 [Fusarium sp. DS 682]|nr:hypothetical protein IL306_008618 [Fusarium sp. DS 682]